MEYLKHTFGSISSINPLKKDVVKAVPRKKYMSTMSKEQRVAKYNEVMLNAKESTQIPIIIEKGTQYDGLTYSGKPLILITNTITIAQLYHIIKQNITFNGPKCTFYMLINGYPPSPSSTLDDVYNTMNLKADDGFLYIELYSQNTFG